MFLVKFSLNMSYYTTIIIFGIFKTTFSLEMITFTPKTFLSFLPFHLPPAIYSWIHPVSPPQMLILQYDTNIVNAFSKLSSVLAKKWFWTLVFLTPQTKLSPITVSILKPKSQCSDKRFSSVTQNGMLSPGCLCLLLNLYLSLITEGFRFWCLFITAINSQ